MFDTIKKLFSALQKGKALKNAETWKNTQAATAALTAILAALAAFSPVDIPAEITSSIAAGIVGVYGLFNLWATVSTSDKIGLPASSATDNLQEPSQPTNLG